MRANPLARAGRAESAAGALVRELFEEHARMVYGVCRVMLRDPHEAEDAAQQTFLSAYDSILKGRAPVDPAPWLATIARNESRARIRKNLPEPLAVVGEADLAPDAATASAQSEEARALAAAIAELPQHQRQALVLREFYGLSYDEVATALDVTPAAVESLLFRGRGRVQDRLRPFRAAAGALTVPFALRDALAATIPGFAPEAAGAAAGGGVAAVVAAKLAAAPAAAKLGAAVVATAAVGAGTYAGTSERPPPPPPPAVVAPGTMLPPDPPATSAGTIGAGVAGDDVREEREREDETEERKDETDDRDEPDDEGEDGPLEQLDDELEKLDDELEELEEELDLDLGFDDDVEAEEEEEEEGEEGEEGERD